MNTCLYRGVVHHRRHDAIGHGFRKSLAMVWLDLDELDEAFERTVLWGRERLRWMSFRERDHLVAMQERAPGASLAERARCEVEVALGRRPEGPVRLLTTLRAFGIGFNPVSFFTCHAADGVAIDAVIAEVHNTPWGEHHCYVVDGAELDGAEDAKAFHVSPFQGMAQRYRWRIGMPGERWTIGIENRCARSGERLFSAGLSLERRPWTAAERTRALLRHPAMPLESLAGIYWHAARLFFEKRAPFHPHPAPKESPMEIPS